MFEGPFGESMVKRAQDKNLVEIKIHDLRNWTNDKHKTVDDHPFGGGAGMVMKVEPIYKAINELRSENSIVILPTPQGKVLNQEMSKQFSTQSHLIFLCPHYEGVDERIIEHLIDEEVSIGDYIMTGGELPAMVIIDSLVRLIPGVLGKEESFQNESFEEVDGQKLLEYPHYTQPANFTTETGENWTVPEILLSGHHENIAKWRKEQSFKRTQERRPDLLD